MNKLQQAGVALTTLAMSGLALADPVADVQAGIADATQTTATIAGAVVLLVLGIKIFKWIRRAF